MDMDTELFLRHIRIKVPDWSTRMLLELYAEDIRKIRPGNRWGLEQEKSCTVTMDNGYELDIGLSQEKLESVIAEATAEHEKQVEAWQQAHAEEEEGGTTEEVKA